MDKTKSLAEWMADGNVGMEKLLEAAGLDRKILAAIVQGRYTPSPQQRQQAHLGTHEELTDCGDLLFTSNKRSEHCRDLHTGFGLPGLLSLGTWLRILRGKPEQAQFF